MKHALLFFEFFALVFPWAILASGAEKNVRHDGHWWLSAPRDEKESYLLGFGDCYVDSLGSKRPPYFENLAELITARYRSGGAKSGEDVPVTMKSLWVSKAGKGKVPRRARGGEVWSEPHAYFDGLWWKGASDAEKLGFVEGEIDCFNEEAPSKFRFRLPASDYVKWLDEAYGVNPKSSAVHSPEDAKIANVLLRKGELNTSSSGPSLGR